MKGDQLDCIEFRGILFEGVIDDDPPRGTTILSYDEPAVFEVYEASIADEEEFEEYFGPCWLSVTDDPKQLIELVGVNEPGEAQDDFLELICIRCDRRRPYDDTDEEHDEYVDE